MGETTNLMRRVTLFLLTLFSAGLHGMLHAAVKIDLSAYRESPDFRVSREKDLLILDWSGENRNSLRMRLNLADPEKLMAELSHTDSTSGKRRTLLKDAAPAYWVYAGKRHGGWDNFFDRPS